MKINQFTLKMILASISILPLIVSGTAAYSMVYAIPEKGTYKFIYGNTGHVYKKVFWRGTSLRSIKQDIAKTTGIPVKEITIKIDNKDKRDNYTLQDEAITMQIIVPLKFQNIIKKWPHQKNS